MRTRSQARSTHLATAVGTLLLWPASANTAEYCVQCSSPSATYRCRAGNLAADAPADPRIQVICITELAKAGQHESCAVARNAQGSCQGALRTVLAPQPAPDVPDAAIAIPAPAAQPLPQGGAVAAPDGQSDEPEKNDTTIERPAHVTEENAASGLKKATDAIAETAEAAGKSVGSAAKKTWNCVASLFSDC